MRIVLRAVLLLMVAVGAAGARAQTDAPGSASTTSLTLPPTPLLPAHPSDLTATEGASGTAPAAFSGTGCSLLPGNASGGPSAAGTDGAAAAGPDRSGAVAPVDCAALYKEDGLTRYASAVYTRAGGAPVPAMALEFGDATGAYSAYTFLRTAMHDPRVTEGDARTGKAHESSADASGTLVWAGTAVLRLYGRVTDAEGRALVAALPKVGGRAGLAPLLPTLEPGDGREKGSERYAVGPVGYQAEGGVLPNGLLGWNKSAEALTGRYGAGSVTLLLYPTPQIAGDRGRAVEGYINQTGPARFGTVKMRRLGPLVGITMGALPAAHAQELLDSLRLNQQVSFDKRMPLEFHAEMQKTYSLMQTIALFCGLGLVACILLALFLGGARAGIRVMQGKPAATEPEFLTINLRNEAKGVLLRHRADGSEIQ